MNAAHFAFLAECAALLVEVLPPMCVAPHHVHIVTSRRIPDRDLLSLRCIVPRPMWGALLLRARGLHAQTFSSVVDDRGDDVDGLQ
jgi:hypothetical protein